MLDWIHEWWITLRYGGPARRAAVSKWWFDEDAWVDAPRPEDAP